MNYYLDSPNDAFVRVPGHVHVVDGFGHDYKIVDLMTDFDFLSNNEIFFLFPVGLFVYHVIDEIYYAIGYSIDYEIYFAIYLSTFENHVFLHVYVDVVFL